MNTTASNSISVKGFSADGYEVLFTFDVKSMAEALAKVTEVRAAGFAAYQPEPVETERQAIMSVMRHLSDSGTPVIAVYPHWKYEGKYGEYKFASIYLDKPEDVAQFEAQSGLKLDELPLSDGEAGVRRRYGSKPNAKEIPVKRSFEMLKILDGTYEDGKPRYRYEYVAKLPITTHTSWTPEDVDTFKARWKKDDLTEADLSRALKVSKWGDWKGTLEEANEAVTAYIKEHLFGDKPAQPKALAKTQSDLPRIKCETIDLREGDVILQESKSQTLGTLETRLEVMQYGGKLAAGQYKLVVKNLKTEEVKTVTWSNGDNLLCAGPKVEAYAKDKSLCKLPNIGTIPVWIAQVNA